MVNLAKVKDPWPGSLTESPGAQRYLHRDAAGRRLVFYAKDPASRLAEHDRCCPVVDGCSLRSDADRDGVRSGAWVCRPQSGHPGSGHHLRGMVEKVGDHPTWKSLSDHQTGRWHVCWWTRNEVATTISTMNTTHHPQPGTADAGAAQAASSPAHRQIKLALDVHAATIVVVRMLDGAKPQPPQTMKPADFLACGDGGQLSTLDSAEKPLPHLRPAAEPLSSLS